MAKRQNKNTILRITYIKHKKTLKPNPFTNPKSNLQTLKDFKLPTYTYPQMIKFIKDLETGKIKL